MKPINAVSVSRPQSVNGWPSSCCPCPRFRERLCHLGYRRARLAAGLSKCLLAAATIINAVPLKDTRRARQHCRNLPNRSLKIVLHKVSLMNFGLRSTPGRSYGCFADGLVIVTATEPRNAFCPCRE